jgi:hypothetical protein
MKVFVKGKTKSVELTTADFLAQGGEGKVYAKGSTVYKVCEPGKMIPSGKFTELSVLTDPHIVKPEDIIVDSKNHEIGYTMKYVRDTYTLCQLFTKAFRVRNSIKPESILDLVRQMQDTIHYVHNHNILLVDLNEFNFLVDEMFKDVYFIDVNSYQTPHYPAMAIMDSIRDRHCNGKFTKVSDWFSFAVISFQMFIGIHPYKGKHPNFPDLESRMKNNVSVFNTEVGYPKAACQPFSVLPDSYLQWYKAVLDKGERVAPPTDLMSVVHVITPKIKVVGGKHLTIDKIREFPFPIIQYYESSGREVFVTEQKIYVDKKEFVNPNPKIVMGFTRTNLPVGVWIENSLVRIKDITNDIDIPFYCCGQKIMEYQGRVYIQNGMDVYQIVFMEMKDKILASSHIVANVLEQSTKLYSGVVIQNLFDAYYVSVFPENKQCQQIAIRELDGQRVIDAKFENRVLMVVSVDRKGIYNKHTFVFKDDWKQYTISKKENITLAGLNFTVLDNGVCVHIDEDENIDIFHVNKPDVVKQIIDDVIDQDMILCHKGANVMFTKENAIYSVTMRKP